MSSVEIAELTGKEHRNVMRDIRTVLEEAGIDESKFGRVYLGGNGQKRPCYHLPRRECDLVVSGYSVPHRLAIIDRWHQLAAETRKASRAASEEEQETEVIIGSPVVVQRATHVDDECPPEFMEEAPPTFNLVVKDGERGVDLRELHRELGSKQQFVDWAKANLSQFVEGEDFEVFHNVMKNSGGRPRKDWSVSIECAKHIAMMEQTDRGRQVRQYFIDFEKSVRDRQAGQSGFQVPTTMREALETALELDKDRERLVGENRALETRALALQQEVGAAGERNDQLEGAVAELAPKALSSAWAFQGSASAPRRPPRDPGARGKGQ